MYNIAVLGAGIIGVSTALNIQKLLPSARIKIISEKFGQETTSWGSGGLFRPCAKYIKGTPEEKIRYQNLEHFILYFITKRPCTQIHVYMLKGGDRKVVLRQKAFKIQ